MRVLPISCALGMLLAPAVAWAATPDQLDMTMPTVPAESVWSMHGGNLQLRFNVDRLTGQGIHLSPASGAKDAKPDFTDYIDYPIYHGDGLRFAAPNGGFEQFLGGKVSVRGGFMMRTDSGERFDFSRFELRADPTDAMRLLLVGTDGLAWFYVNHLMYVLVDDYSGFYIRSADVNATPEFARRVGALNLANAYIGELKMISNIVKRPASFSVEATKAALDTPNFHGSNGFQADVLLMNLNLQFMRCRTSTGVNGCTGAGGDDGEVVFAPNATLRNTNNANSADVPWYPKFSTSPYSYPYPGNDQHPYLVWNLYRVTDGQLQQIAASGVKHAFLTTNVDCSQASGYILWHNCMDTYGTGNNDAINDLGPRSELVPASGRWGRCYSVFDSNCDGIANSVPSDQYRHRLVVRESQLEVAASTYYSDSWYVVQDDINIYNTMGYRSLVPNFVPGTTQGSNVWTVQEGVFTTGPLIDAWVNPIANPTQNVELNTAEGHAKVAVKVKPLDQCPINSGLSGTCYRYDYAVHNFDLARAILNTSAPANAEANLHVVSNKGFVSFTLPRGAESALFMDASNFADIDTVAGNDWPTTLFAYSAKWSAPVGNELNWGQLYRFSVVSNAMPDSNHVRSVVLGIGGGNGPDSYSVPIMVPNTFGIFADGMEDY